MAVQRSPSQEWLRSTELSLMLLRLIQTQCKIFSAVILKIYVHPSVAMKGRSICTTQEQEGIDVTRAVPHVLHAWAN
jgi:hypothetical protein